MKQVFPVLVLVAGLAWAQGCANYRVTLSSSDPSIILDQGGTMHAFFWGIWYDPQVMQTKCDKKDETIGINDVEIKRNYLHDLASVLTLGIWMPIEVKFRCQAPPIRMITPE